MYTTPSQKDITKARKSNSRGQMAQDRKQQSKGGVQGSASTNPSRRTEEAHNKMINSQKTSKKSDAIITNPSPLFAHLIQGQHDATTTRRQSNELPSTSNYHPAVARFILRSKSFANIGGTRRCTEMLLAIRQTMQDYHAPAGTAVCRHLDHHYLKPMIGAMVAARPLATSMANAVRSLRMFISMLPPESTDLDAQYAVISYIDAFLSNRLRLAKSLIVQYGMSKIEPGDVILTFGHSAVVCALLIDAAQRLGHHAFRVVIVDSRPLNEGLITAKALSAFNISVTFVSLTALGYKLGLRNIKKTIVGAAAMTANGSLLSRVGTAAVCALSRNHNVPVIVCCETVKFTDRTQMDPFVPHELASPDLLAQCCTGTSPAHLKDWRINLPNLHILNTLYDCTPAEHISVVITEIGLIPPTSIPVVLREYSSVNVAQTSAITASGQPPTPELSSALLVGPSSPINK